MHCPPLTALRSRDRSRSRDEPVITGLLWPPPHRRGKRTQTRSVYGMPNRGGVPAVVIRWAAPSPLGDLRCPVGISDDSVRHSAAKYLVVQPRPHGISSWTLVDGTGSPDGQTAVIRLKGTADIPIAAGVVAAFGGSVDITVESRARSAIR